MNQFTHTLPLNGLSMDLHCENNVGITNFALVSAGLFFAVKRLSSKIKYLLFQSPNLLYKYNYISWGALLRKKKRNFFSQFIV